MRHLRPANRCQLPVTTTLPAPRSLRRSSASSSLAARALIAITLLAFCIANRSTAAEPPDVAASNGVAQKNEEAFFETHIRPLLIARCYECHAEGAASLGGNLRLDSAAGWQAGGDRGSAIVPGDAEASLLLRAVRYNDADLQMPPDARLTDEQIALLERWIRAGAIDPRVQADPAERSRSGQPSGPPPSDPEAGRTHWAFQPLRRPTRPQPSAIAPAPESTVPESTAAVSAPTDPHGAPPWAWNTIDRFVALGHQREQLQPRPTAAPRHLARRLYVQLTGLPPTPEQMDRFLQSVSSLDAGLSDPSTVAASSARDAAIAAAVRQLVEQLLATPQYGERWGRHWLDLARYADSNGLDENFLFREAWRYRNWVFEAVRGDMPYDQFLREQLAGDLLQYDSVEARDRQRIAAGFLVVGPKVLLGNEEQRQRMEVADEQLDTLGRAVLGQTLGCARCHDHKFDPIPTADYYALAGILTSTQVMETRYMLGEQRGMERLVGIGPEGETLDEAYERFWRDAPAKRGTLAQAQAALELLKKNDLPGVEALAQKQAGAVSPEALAAEQPLETRTAAQQAFVTSLEAELKNPPAIPPRAMIPADRAEIGDEHIRLAGQADRKGQQVPRGFLQVLRREQPWELPAQQSGRLQLADWLTDESQGAGALVARVLANRVWHHLVGQALVPTLDNFGRTGEPPSHPELLDYLAARLIDSGWSVHALVREIATSHTFALACVHDEASHQRDPDNRLLWRAHRRRLDPETLRDAMLLAAGQLDLRPMQSTVWYLGDQATGVGINARRRTDFPCRSVYLPVIRNDLPELFDVFDFANPHSTTGARPRTTVATQALFLMNNEQVMDAAAATADRLLALPSITSRATPANDAAAPADASVDEPRLRQLYAWIMQDEPTGVEVEALTQYIASLRAGEFPTEPPGGDARSMERQLWTRVCHTLLALSRFQFVE